MALQNRVDPNGDILANDHRGGMLGNRGGKLHGPDQTLGPRRWASKSWIACRTEYKDRHRTVMGSGYTELFFLDEATALAAGHRPCFECRRHAAHAFAAAWADAKALSAPPKAAEMDATLHAERLQTAGRRKIKRKTPIQLTDAPAGAMIELWGAPWLVGPDFVLRWSFGGYTQALAKKGIRDETALLLTPPSAAEALRAGYRPWAATELC
ncbi:MAG: hypothetical protein MRY74_01695 [Neomegalonema sp.]|nr:hypothetical protein [Neomegalonema sp.]